MKRQLIKLFSNNLYIFFVILGIFWILLHFILRFIVERFPYKITVDVPKFSIVVAIILFLVHLVNIYIHISTIFAFNQKENALVLVIKIFIDFIYWKPLREFHNKIIVNLPFSGYILEDLGNTYIHKCNSKSRIFFSILISNFIPRLIVAFAFFIDVVLYKQFAYIYILLVLIVFPLMFDSFIYILDNFAFRNIQELEKNVIVLYVPEEDKTLFLWRSNNSVLENKDLEFYEKYWFMFRDFMVFFDYIKTIKAKFLPYILLVTSSCYVIDWTYYLNIVLTIQDIYILLYEIIAIYSYGDEPFSGFYM